MKLAILALGLSLSLGGAYALADCGGGSCGKCEKKESAGATTQPAAPINKVCPVEKGEVDPKVTTVYEGKTIGFCCADCIVTFKKDPAKYMKDLK